MGFKQSGLVSKGLARRKSGTIYCLECEGMLRFNSGNSAVFHDPECSKWPEGPTYMGESQVILNAVEKKDV